MTPRSIRRAAERKAEKDARNAVPTEPPEAATVETASAAQFAANRANAQFSTGPTSDLGRAISSRNNTRHGLTIDLQTADPFKVLPNEDQAEFDRSLAAFTAEWQPATATELDLVQRMVIHCWLRCRATRLQDQLLAAGMHELKDFKHFEIYGRYHTTHARAFNKAFSDLMRLRNFQMRQRKDEALLERRAQDVQIRFESQKRKAEEHAAKMETLRLRQEAQKHRNQHGKRSQTTTSATEVAHAETA